jgi:hypothetical protein
VKETRAALFLFERDTRNEGRGSSISLALSMRILLIALAVSTHSLCGSLKYLQRQPSARERQQKDARTHLSPRILLSQAGKIFLHSRGRIVNAQAKAGKSSLQHFS